MVNFVEKKYINEVGIYNVVISNIDLKCNEKGNQYFEIILKDNEGATRKININCKNSGKNGDYAKGEKACEIGYGTLLKLLRAMNEEKLIDNCKYLEPKAKDYNELFKLIIENQLIGQIDKTTEFGLEIYNKKSKEVFFNAISGQDEMTTQLGEKFFSLKEVQNNEKEDLKLDDSIPC